MKCECGTEAGVGHGICLERRDSRHHSVSRAYVASTCPANKSELKAASLQHQTESDVPAGRRVRAAHRRARLRARLKAGAFAAPW